MANLTQEDLDAIKSLMQVTLDEAIEEKLVTKDMISHLPTKEEFYEQTDKIMKELKDIREEMTVLSGNDSEHSDRLEKLEDIHPNSSHSLAV